MNDGSLTVLAVAQLGVLAGLILFPIAAYAMYRTVRYVLSLPDGRRGRAREMLRIWAKRIAVAIGVVVIVSYGLDVRQRLRAGNCQREASPQESGPYMAEMCLLPARGSVLLRLYSRTTGALLVERMYEDPEPRLIWTRDEVIYDTAATDGKGSVSLPPTWLDRLRAKLP
ncbi:hypothetical protein LMG23992_02690 [Cupriavidus laharis]|uniref:DUF3592 domain-containing protein n=1 Tax=Cupriavidus laharis TaxID=151654 RepID=A0ABN7YPD0_9BURK|nr:hypothetical protein [Cupriavidus laharis]CAG9174276.1 hypothetical protein LMG23992_02690 [Cupriavidus laharis]